MFYLDLYLYSCFFVFSHSDILSPLLPQAAFDFSQVHLASLEARALSYPSHGMGQHMATMTEGQPR